MPSPNPPTAPRADSRRRVAYVVVALVLAAIFIGGYVVGILRNMR